MKLFTVKKGLNAASLKPKGNIYPADETQIGAPYYNQVLMALDLKVMSTDGNGNFNPQGNMTRAEVAEAFVTLLDLTGDI